MISIYVFSFLVAGFRNIYMLLKGKQQIVILFLLMTSGIISFGQTSKFDELANEMFFNIFIHKPDSSVFFFIKKYFPTFTTDFEPGGWTIYPKNPPELHLTVHSLMFRHHPYFDAKFREGRLDLLASETKDGPPGVTDFQLWFMFDTKSDADKAFKKISMMFNRLSKKKNVREENGKIIAEYTDQNSLENTNSIQFILTKDELHNNKYKLLFRIGAFTYSK
jgi:hypothetical protein